MTTTSIDKSRLFKRAWFLFKQGYNGTFSYCLKKVWAELKQAVKDAIAKIELAAAPRFTGCNLTPSPETMAAYYNTSCYKGD